MKPVRVAPIATIRVNVLTNTTSLSFGAALLIIILKMCRVPVSRSQVAKNAPTRCAHGQMTEDLPELSLLLPLRS